MAQGKAWIGDRIIEIYDKGGSTLLPKTNADLQIKLRDLKDARNHLMLSQDFYEKYPKLKKRFLSANVRAIEAMQREFDELSGFSLQQQLSHDLIVKVQTEASKTGHTKATALS